MKRNEWKQKFLIRAPLGGTLTYKKFVEHSFLFTLVKRNECGRISFRSVSVLGAYLVLPRDPKSQVCTDLVEIEGG